MNKFTMDDLMLGVLISSSIGLLVNIGFKVVPKVVARIKDHVETKERIRNHL